MSSIVRDRRRSYRNSVLYKQLATFLNEKDFQKARERYSENIKRLTEIVRSRLSESQRKNCAQPKSPESEESTDRGFYESLMGSI